MRILMLKLVVLLLFSACTDSGTGPRLEDYPPGTYIDEPILVEASDWVLPNDGAEHEFTFDIGDLPLVQSQAFNDLEIAYTTSSSCDEDMWVHNPFLDYWHMVGRAPDPSTYCACVISTQRHALSAKGIDVTPVLDDQNHVRFRGDGSSPEIRVLRLNANYFAVPVTKNGDQYYDGLAYADHSFWLSSNWFDMIYRVSLSGSILTAFPSPEPYPFGLAFDGSYVWLADGTDRIFKLSPHGYVLGSFSVPTDFPGGLAWGNSKLWLLEYEGTDPEIFCIDPDGSCAVGEAVIISTLASPCQYCWGLAWNGDNLLVGGEILYEVSLGGEILQEHDLPVIGVKDIAWDGEAVWLLNQGPHGCPGRDQVITRLRLR